ncbi:hypothetical protein RhiJN_17222 [Ceratobasidium sp. AG-Ba]|nr:hypothetical protein RhiJN_17222 [Ceratobasidium sp. AG-Ba]
MRGCDHKVAQGGQRYYDRTLDCQILGCNTGLLGARRRHDPSSEIQRRTETRKTRAVLLSTGPNVPTRLTTPQHLRRAAQPPSGNNCDDSSRSTGAIAHTELVHVPDICRTRPVASSPVPSDMRAVEQATVLQATDRLPAYRLHRTKRARMSSGARRRRSKR